MRGFEAQRPGLFLAHWDWNDLEGHRGQNGMSMPDVEVRAALRRGIIVPVRVPDNKARSGLSCGEPALRALV